jgi:alkylation response protein AidB-like acyl-CoA dehydrogenase
MRSTARRDGHEYVFDVQNLVFHTIEVGAAGVPMTLAFRVEQLARDANVLQIYASTDEIQITPIAEDLLRR